MTNPGLVLRLRSVESEVAARRSRLPEGLTLDMPSITAAFGVSTYALIQAELDGIGIKVNFTDVGLEDIHRDPRPEVPGHLFHPAAGPRPLAPDPVPATEGRHVQSVPLDGSHGRWLSHDDQTGSSSQADAAAKALNQYLVQQAWFAPFYRTQSSFVADSQTSVKVQAGNA